ncbi:hypothetical protein PG991_001643 [Apiospora marii]|uniref:Ent-kaurene synthase n=1 Tax=Apiospora marii TaxID=335849 RepID=A0ABR1SQ92_9PEZI
MSQDFVVQNDRLNADAVALIQQAWGTYSEAWGSGSMSCAIYDTAWVSMVTKEIDGQKQWLFPESFEYLISTRTPNGGWAGENVVEPQIDGILNTAASLLSLIRHHSEPLNTPKEALVDIETTIHQAEASLASQLRDWDVSATAHVGFEVIVPALLKLLRSESSSTKLDFEGEHILQQIHAAKLSRFRPQDLYGKRPSTALHSLEALIGLVDFDRLSHHKVGGSMMASPSSTAAYLMNITAWDDEAESYLRHVVQAGVGGGNGAVPSAYPSTVFEYSWILSTMLRSGYSAADLACPELDAMAGSLERAYEQGKHILGFAPGLPADVDDTAKTILCMNKLGRPSSPEAMIDSFETSTHFCTFHGERNPSFTANCNALSALLAQPAPSRYSKQILKATEFLCTTWWESDEKISDKWNTSWLYPSLLLVQAFMDLLDQVERGNLEALDEDLRLRVYITLFQACLRALLHQSNPDSSEETAYHILVLCEARRLPLFEALDPIVDDKLKRLVSSLESATECPMKSKSNHLWIEKVSYGSRVLTQSYKLAALKAVSHPVRVSTTAFFDNNTSSRSSTSTKFVKLLKQTPIFASTPEWQIQASMTEAALFQPLLRRRRLDVFPRKDMAPDKYFDLIPLTWTSCNNRSARFVPTSFIYEMMVISFLDFQADEFIEAVAGPAFQDDLPSLHSLIDGVFEDLALDKLADGNDFKSSNGDESISDSEATAVNGAGNAAKERQEVRKGLIRFVRHIASHKSVRTASAWDQRSTLRELQIFLHAHVTQSEDNQYLVRAKSQDKTSPGKGSLKDGYFRWIRATSGDHTACTYSYAFAGCLLSSSRRQQRQLTGQTGRSNKDKTTTTNGNQCAANTEDESFPTGRTKYLSAAACQHLAAMCRMYNDYGSVARDAAETNLNSVDFPELQPPVTPQQSRSHSNGQKRSADDAGLNGNDDDDDSGDFPKGESPHHSVEESKKTLFALAQYERAWFQDAMGRLREEMRSLGRRRDMEAWDVFCEVTDLYGQIYVVRDIASRMANGNGNGKKQCVAATHKA